MIWSRRRGTSGLAACVALMIAISGCSPMASDPEVETVRIAADLELSGDLSRLGTVFRNALELRVEQINEQSLLRNNRRLELVVRDNRSDPAVSATNLRDFSGDPSVVAIISGACWRCLESSLDVIDAQGIPTISLAAPDAVVDPLEERQYIFKLGPNARDVAAAIIANLPQDVRTLAVVATDDEYGTDGMEAMQDAVDNTEDLTMVIGEVLTPGGGGIAATTRSIAEYREEPPVGQMPGADASAPTGSDVTTGPDAVVAWGFAPFGAEIAAGLRDAGYEGPIFLDPGAADDLFISGSSAQALAGSLMVFTETLVIDEVVATSPAKANRRNWFNEYTARHGTYHAYSSFAADAIEILTSAINRLRSIDREGLRSAIESVELDGLTGTLRMSPRHHSGLTSQALTILVAREDRWRLFG